MGYVLCITKTISLLQCFDKMLMLKERAYEVLDAASLFQVRLLISSIFSLWKRTIFHERYKHEDGEIKSTF